MNNGLIIDPDGDKTWWKDGKRHRTDGPAVERANGDKHWIVDGEYHHTDGPSSEWCDGSKAWHVNGLRHRTDGPAIEHANGDKEWWVNGQLHRIDGPAITQTNDGNGIWRYINGHFYRTNRPAEAHHKYKWWYIDDRLHRANGPAIENADGTTEWWYNGVRETREENYAREKPHLERQMHGLQIWLPVETSGARFPLVNLIIDYGI
jgi:hypothetical protein